MYWVELGSRYTALVEEDGVYKVKEGFARHPVIEVSWVRSNGLLPVGRASACQGRRNGNSPVRELKG